MRAADPTSINAIIIRLRRKPNDIHRTGEMSSGPALPPKPFGFSRSSLIDAEELKADPDQALLDRLRKSNFVEGSPSFWKEFSDEAQAAHDYGKIAMELSSQSSPFVVGEATNTRDGGEKLASMLQAHAPEFENLSPLIGRLSEAHGNLRRKLRGEQLAWQGSLGVLEAVRQKQDTFEQMEREYEGQMKKFLSSKSTQQAKMVEEEKALSLKDNFLKLQRFDLESTLLLFSHHRKHNIVMPISGILSGFKELYEELKEVFEGRSIDGKSAAEHIEAMQEAANDLKQRKKANERATKQMRRQIEKEVLSDTQNFTGSAMVGSGTGIRDLDASNKTSDGEESVALQEGFLYLPPTTASSTSFPGSGPVAVANFTKVWCVLEGGRLCVSNVPPRPPSRRLSTMTRPEIKPPVSDERGRKRFGSRASAFFGRAQRLFGSEESSSAFSYSLDLRLTTVKEERQKNLRFAFSVVSPQQSITLQAKSSGDVQRWMSAIQEAIATELNQQTGLSTVREGASTSTPDEKNETLRVLRSVDGNSVCADCGDTEPEWVSLNLGVLLCLKCSGLHRSLGTHISKVRSATLDKLDPFLVEFLLAVGNSNANSVWESSLKGQQRPDPNSNSDMRQMWVKAKYELKSFIEKTTASKEVLSRALFDAVNGYDHVACLQLLSQGADPDWHNPDEEDRTALLQSVFCGSTICNELFLQNGAKPDEVESRGWNVLHYAAYYSDAASVEQILLRGGGRLAGVQDLDGRTPYDIAYENSEHADAAESAAAIVNMLWDALQKNSSAS